MDIKDLTPEQIEKAKGMSLEEIHELAAKEGLPISDEELEQVAGGWECTKGRGPCPKGGEHEWEQTDSIDHGTRIAYIETCKKCGAEKRSFG